MDTKNKGKIMISIMIKTIITLMILMLSSCGGGDTGTSGGGSGSNTGNTNNSSSDKTITPDSFTPPGAGNEIGEPKV